VIGIRHICGGRDQKAVAGRRAPRNVGARNLQQQVRPVCISGNRRNRCPSRNSRRRNRLRRRLDDAMTGVRTSVAGWPQPKSVIRPPCRMRAKGAHRHRKGSNDRFLTAGRVWANLRSRNRPTGLLLGNCALGNVVRTGGWGMFRRPVVGGRLRRIRLGGRSCFPALRCRAVFPQPCGNLSAEHHDQGQHTGDGRRNENPVGSSMRGRRRRFRQLGCFGGVSISSSPLNGRRRPPPGIWERFPKTPHGSDSSRTNVADRGCPKEPQPEPPNDNPNPPPVHSEESPQSLAKRTNYRLDIPHNGSHC